MYIATKCKTTCDEGNIVKSYMGQLQIDQELDQHAYNHILYETEN